MKEVRPPKRPLIFYYCVAMLILLLFNFLAMPWMARQQIQEVDYGTFMDMAENQDLGQVEIQEQENQIVFTNKDETAVYSTGMIPDPDLKQMLKDSGAEFSGQVIQQTDPIHFRRPRAVYVQAHDEEHGRPQRHGLRQVQRQGVCQVL